MNFLVVQPPKIAWLLAIIIEAEGSTSSVRVLGVNSRYPMAPFSNCSIATIKNHYLTPCIQGRFDREDFDPWITKVVNEVTMVNALTC